MKLLNKEEVLLAGRFSLRGCFTNRLAGHFQFGCCRELAVLWRFWFHTAISFRLEHWKRSGYDSLSVSLESDSDDDDEEEEWEEPEAVDIRYVVGDVTCPQNTGKADAIVVHCVGEWHCTGVFKALAT